MPELRKDPISSRWVIVATGRAKRPRDFAREPVQPFGSGFCPFCYGAEQKTPPEVLAFRPSGERNQPGWSLRVVPNKRAAVRRTHTSLSAKPERSTPTASALDLSSFAQRTS